MRGINGGTPCAGSSCGGVASKALKDVNASLKRFKDATKGEEHSSRAYERIIEESIQFKEGLQKAKVSPPLPSLITPNFENSAMAKILQKIKAFKTTISLY